jgi:oxygen-independent coproporphyrinogen III oxidase
MEGQIIKKIRRNIHTYPFKYQHIPPQQFFAPDLASIYIHIPFCSTKCHFCDYTVYTNKGPEAQEQYVQSLCQEIRQFKALPPFPRYRIEAIYFGGGTPGVLTGEQLIRILQACKDEFELTDDCEVCAEFDPACVSAEKIQEVVQGGFTRISVGVQTFNDDILKQVNRPHDTSDIYRAFEAIDRAEVAHTNVDLIYPLPGLTNEIWRDSVDKAMQLRTSCVTIYGLEIWPGTAFGNWVEKGKLKLPSGDEEVEMYDYAASKLEAAGYQARSNSGYYNPQMYPRYCRFLDYYWRTWPMIGFGVSSKSVVGNHLWTNVKSIKEYMARVAAGESVMDFGTRLSKPQEMRRVMIRGLKMTEVDKADFLSRFGVEMEDAFGPEIEGLVADGFMRNEPHRVVLTKRGRIYGTNVYERFYTDDDLRPPATNEVQFGISQLIAEV